MSEHRIRLNKIRRQREVRKQWILLFTALCMSFIISLTVGGFLSNAKTAGGNGQKYYTSIMVEQGDTLWSIADEYMDQTQYLEKDAYIDEVIRVNGLPDDAITAGRYLIVPYFAEDEALIAEGVKH